MSRSAVSGFGSVDSNLLTPTTTSSPDSIRAPARGVRGHQRRLHVAGLDGGHRAAHRLHPVDLGPGTLDELGHLRLDDVAALEQVLVLQQVRLVGQHLLDPQRPLLVPRPRQAERLVPGRQLHGPGAGVLAEASPRASPARSAGRCSPAAPRSAPGELTCTPYRKRRALASVTPYRSRVSSSHSCTKARILHISSTNRTPALTKNEMRATTSREALRRHLAAVAHRVQDGDRRAHRVRELLHRRRPGLLQVVAADVDRVPLRHAGDRVGDHVGDQPQRRRRAGTRRSRGTGTP